MNSMYNAIPETTFGLNPGAKYLCRTLNEVQSPNILRNVGKRITATASQVAELEAAYKDGNLSPKTLANSLRLMREEISASRVDYGFCKMNLIDQLRCNVQIGIIKRGLRLASIGRKAEHVMTSPYNKSSNIVSSVSKALKVKTSSYYFKDSTTNKFFKAGSQVYDLSQLPIEACFESVSRFSSEVTDEGVSDLLNKRSDARRVRLNKPHVTTKEI